MSSLLICVLLELALSLQEGRFRLPVSTRVFLPAKSSSRRRVGDLSRINSSVGDSESVELELVDLYIKMAESSAKLQFSGFVYFVHALANYFYLHLAATFSQIRYSPVI